MLGSAIGRFARRRRLPLLFLPAIKPIIRCRGRLSAWSWCIVGPRLGCRLVQFRAGSGESSIDVIARGSESVANDEDSPGVGEPFRVVHPGDRL